MTAQTVRIAFSLYCSRASNILALRSRVASNILAVRSREASNRQGATLKTP